MATTTRSDERGSAIVEFVLVVPLLLAVAMAVLQVALIGHARAVLTAAAAEGARAAALAGADGRSGVARVRTLLAQNALEGIVDDVRVEPGLVDGAPVMTARIRAHVPVVGWVGPAVAMEVDGHALREGVW